MPAGERRTIDWSEAEYANFGRRVQVCRHPYHELDVFDPAQLIALLDDYPRRWLQCFTMGTDPARHEEWKAVDIAGCTGAELHAAVDRGRLWLNLIHVERYDALFADLIEGMYAQLNAHCPHLDGATPAFSTLLVSSPAAQVYYHMDAEPNMLWHLRGNKHVWVYPAMDPSFVPQAVMENIFAGETDENAPYDPVFDEHAIQYLLEPGDVVCWPNNSPHRVVNVDTNVSLATSYATPTTFRRQYIQCANRFLLRNLGIENRSLAEDGAIPALKRLTYRAANRMRPFAPRDRRQDYRTDLRVDPSQPEALARLDTPILPEFGRSDPEG